MECVHLEQEEKEDLEISGRRNYQLEFTAWNELTGRMEKKNIIITLGTKRCENIDIVYVKKQNYSFAVRISP